MIDRFHDQIVLHFAEDVRPRITVQTRGELDPVQGRLQIHFTASDTSGLTAALTTRAAFTPMNRIGQHIKRFCLHRYPPKVYVFYPLYKWFRRRWGLPMAVSNLLVWVVSGVLHGVVLASFGSPVAGTAFAVIFFTLGVVSTIVVLRCKRTSHQVLRAIRVRTR